MKALVLFSLLSILTLQGSADDSNAQREIHKQRKSLLELIAKQAERDYGEGRCSLREVFNAKVKLNKFQRDLTSDWHQKRKYQSQIVEIENSRIAVLERQFGNGDPKVSSLKVMRARERHLAAQQRLLKIEEHIQTRSAEQHGARQPVTAIEKKSEGNTDGCSQ